MGSRSDLPSPLYAHQLVAADGKLYAIGGRTVGANELGVVLEYDIQTNAWTEKAKMPTGRANHAAVMAEGRIYVLGGNTYRTSNEVYDPATNEWTVADPLPEGLQHLNYSAAYFRGSIYLFGGVGPHFEGLSNVDVYDPLADAWESGTPMPEARMVTGAAPLGDKIVVVAGLQGDETSSEVFLYDPALEEWEPAPAFPYPVSLAGIASSGERVYLAGGTDHREIFSGLMVGHLPY